MQLEQTLDAIASELMQEALGLEERPAALLRATNDAKHGDYQLNGAMALAKKLKRPPRELAEAMAAAIKVHPAIADAEVAGPGFVNLRLSDAWVSEQLTAMLDDDALGVTPVATPETIVVDYSSPNIAKQMHVGHLRSTIIGHSIVQLLRAVGHTVIGDNHLGDWGTQFGLLIVGMREYGDEAALKRDAIVELERVYKAASARAKDDEAFQEAARAELAKLQSGDAENRRLWQTFVEATRATLNRMYARLGVSFDEWLGESAYDAMLADVAKRLEDKGIAREDDGALCVFWPDLFETTIEGAVGEIPKKLKKQKEPFIVRKKDGAYLYSTTDIATVLYRRDEMKADRSVYVVGAPQALHFEQLFAVARLLGVTMGFDHVAFGSVLGDDGKVLRTRSGAAVTLESLLDDAEERARARIDEGREEGTLRIEEGDVDEAVRVIGIGAVKYADLMQNRMTDYKYDPDKMVAFKGNASPYIQYQYARVRSMLDKGGVDLASHRGAIALAAPEELALGRTLLRFPDVVHKAASGYSPNLVGDHVYELATAFSRFFFECPVLKAEEPRRTARLGLSVLTARQLERGLGLLGIGVLDRM